VAGLAAELAVLVVDDAWGVAGLAAEPTLFAGVDAGVLVPAGFLTGGLDGVLVAGLAGVAVFAGVAAFAGVVVFAGVAVFVGAAGFAGVAVLAGVEPAGFGVDLVADAGAFAAGVFLGVSLSTIFIFWTPSTQR
jgi:hypothetical protein